ncbi:hypothetical protein MSG28_003009 [Choristoneura fumiferana]|uniref:Uncharacterized protein n=1 Tax=Choristoneura fumiferana TaxID=7141 RepID=A0ACC0JKB8_CHOFU|nr:hypothetical protein MSG28_003009 [Choristoneura fumiferana]
MNQSNEPQKTPRTYPVEPDKELLVWEKWITIRKEEAMKLAKQTKRSPADLVINLVQDVREDKERKIVLEDAQIEEKVGVRDTLWDQPHRLKQRCYCDPVYEIHRTPAQMGQPPLIEHIGVPKDIQKTEMGVIGNPERARCTFLDSDYHNYRDKREKELHEKIVKIDPFRPEIGGLIVRGKKPKTPPKKLPPMPNILIHLDSNKCKDLYGVYAIRINNTVIYKAIPGQNLMHLVKMKFEPWHEQCTSWSYYFNVPVKRVGRSKLYLQNLGTVTLRYCWKKIKKPIPFIPEDTYDQVFFFNKNEDVLPPGQDKEIFFTFISDKPGIYSELWEFSLCNICFFDTLASKLVVNLNADSVENLEKRQIAVAKLKTDIYEKSIRNLVYELVNDVVDKATVTTPQIYPYKKYFLEAELFVMKNPVCFYHQTEVMKMRNLYAEMSNNKEWDLSITSWREAMLKLEYDNRMKYYELLRISHNDFLKPWYEGENLQKSKYRVVKFLLGQLADKFEVERSSITNLYIPSEDDNSTEQEIDPSSRQRMGSVTRTNPIILYTINNVFYIQMYEHVATTIEMCAGILSSLDLNRWIEFDFCKT